MALASNASPMFRYVRVANSLRDQILSGSYQPGECLPRQHDLAKQYDVAFNTLKQALDLLEREGYLIRKAGQGTYASMPEQHVPIALVVDDEPDILRFFSKALADYGWEGVAVASGQAALEEAQSRQFQLIFLDLVMPGMNGVEAFEQIRKFQPQTQVVFVTAYPDSALMTAALQIGPFEIMNKPVELAALRFVLGISHRRYETDTGRELA